MTRTPDPIVVAKQARALEMHLAGVTYDGISKALGYASRAAAHKAVATAMARGETPAAGRDNGDTIRTELARLDALLSTVWPLARQGDLAAVDRALRISERRTTLLALGDLTGARPETKGSTLDDLAAQRRARKSRLSSGTAEREHGRTGSDSAGG